MMPIQSRENLYPGINPHLNSFLQHEQGWKGFHTLFLSQMGQVIEDRLPPGYLTSTEESLQIGIYDRGHLTKQIVTTPDIMIHRSDPRPTDGHAGAIADSPTMTLPLIEDDTDEQPVSVVIYDVDKLVTRIELLSPANKAPESHAARYQEKRQQTLDARLRLVEIDFLHARIPVHHRIPSYEHQDDAAYPYMILISDPRPTHNTLQFYGIGVLDKLPVISIPLENSDAVSVDCMDVYNTTFRSRRIFYETRSTYESDPQKFHTFTTIDQQKIRDYMQYLQETYTTQ